ncbi:MAG TPA: hypothetical protein VK789_34130 [Bryobacteraceae bacterium]|nr:hypothetical protein [Bryobacteraceae bacterium]
MLIPVRQHLTRRKLDDIPRAVRQELEGAAIASTLKPGARVAIGAGSRGISNLAEIVRATVDFFQSAEARPFVFPAMGSHGAATAEGQASVLAHYGINESSMGCPVVSSFDVVSLGRTAEGIETFAGKDAWESDGIFLINRVKWHTSFAGPLESGVAKMLAIGMGKIEAARSCHGHARSLGMDNVIRSAAAHLLATGKILGGLAILEDACHNTAQVTALPAKGFIEREVELLRLTKSWMARIPVPALDILIVDEIGKNISGTGMDLKIVNRGVHGQYNPWPETPQVQRIFIRSLSELSYGNAVGIGLADVIHDRILNRVDVNAGRINARTSGSLAAVRTPLHFPSDRECLDLLMATVGKFNPAEVTIGHIQNTLDLGRLALSENLRDDIRKNPALEITGSPFELEYDSAGNFKL